MQTLFALLLVVTALLYVLARWLPAAWLNKLLGRSELARVVKQASASSCSEHCKACGNESPCPSTTKDGAKTIQILPKPSE